MLDNFRKLEKAKQSQKKLNSIAGTTVFIIAFFFVFLFGNLYLTYGKVEDTEPIQILSEDLIFDLESNTLKIAGMTTNSAKAFTGYKYKIKNDCLYLKLNYTLATSKNRSGDFTIMIKDDLSKVKKVYLQGKARRDLKLLWEG